MYNFFLFFLWSVSDMLNDTIQDLLLWRFNFITLLVLAVNFHLPRYSSHTQKDVIAWQCSVVPAWMQGAFLKRKYISIIKLLFLQKLSFNLIRLYLLYECRAIWLTALEGTDWKRVPLHSLSASFPLLLFLLHPPLLFLPMDRGTVLDLYFIST